MPVSSLKVNKININCVIFKEVPFLPKTMSIMTSKCTGAEPSLEIQSWSKENIILLITEIVFF